MRLTNVEQHAIWNGTAGQHRLNNPDQDDEEARALQPWLMQVAAIQPGERVLDVGCGSGQSTRGAARLSAPGTVLGLDLSAGLLDRARRLTADEGLDNVSYEQADGQVHQFEPAVFDIAISRFGVMFFADLLAAFRNIRHALRPGGRVAFMVWQRADLNEWASAIRDALASGAGRQVIASPAGSPSPFSLADTETVTAMLDQAGFLGIGFTDVREPVYYGQDADAAYDFVRGLWSTTTALNAMAADEASRATERLRATMRSHDSGRGVFFDSRAWIISAYR